MSRKENDIYCNRCGKKICAQEGRDYASYLAVSKEWGYFSDKKDGTRHCFDLCEECYDKLVEQFIIPPEKQRVTELL